MTMPWRGRALACALGLLAAAFAAPGQAAEPARIAIIIDDMGRDPEAGQRVIDLPGPLACAFLPHAPHSRALAERAHASGKEVMLHLPMQSMQARPLDPGALTLDMTRTRFLRTLDANLARVPHVVGVNNHMGSLLTRHPGHMAWLMEALRARGLFFVDSRTTHHTVARRIAFEKGLPSRRRDVFLDPRPGGATVEREFDRLLAIARRKGSALAIGHPYPDTLALLERELPRLAQAGIDLVPVRRLIDQQQERDAQWRLSSSPWHRVAKNSKPSPSSTCCAAPASK